MLNMDERDTGSTGCRFCGESLKLKLPVSCGSMLKTDELECSIV